MKITISMCTDNGSVVSAITSVKEQEKAIKLLRNLWKQCIELQQKAKVFLKGWGPGLTAEGVQLVLSRDVLLPADVLKRVRNAGAGPCTLPTAMEIYVGTADECKALAEVLSAQGVLVIVKPADL